MGVIFFKNMYLFIKIIFLFGYSLLKTRFFVWTRKNDVIRAFPFWNNEY